MSVYAASTQTQKDEQVQIEKALAELESLRHIRKLDKEQMEALNQKVKALEDLVAIERQRAEAYKSAEAERATVNNIDAERVKILEQALADFKQERTRLLKERDSARRNGRLFSGVAFALGVLVTVFVRGNN